MISKENQEYQVDFSEDFSTIIPLPVAFALD